MLLRGTVRNKTRRVTAVEGSDRGRVGVKLTRKSTPAFPLIESSLSLLQQQKHQLQRERGREKVE